MKELGEWSKLGRDIIRDILENEGGIQALLPFICLAVILAIIGFASYALHGKQKEINRITAEKSKLEDIVLHNRRSSAGSKKGG